MNAVPKFDSDAVKAIEFSPEEGCNTEDDVLLSLVAANIRRGLPQIQPHVPQSTTAILVCGGPSLAETEKELIEAYWAGGKIIAVNGTYRWCLERNLKPSAAIMLDARAFNARFVEQDVPGCKYLLASQCHPSMFDMCRDRETLIWHACSAGEAELELLNEYYFKRTHPVTLGTTVGVRGISLLRMLGFQHIEIFGLDSCWLDDKHHGYAQPENNRDGRLGVWLRPKGRDDLAQRFVCAPWHCKQADDFMKLVKERGHLFQLNVHGRGLIATMIQTGAQLENENES